MTSNHEEPTNEELGIVPVRGWPLLLIWAGIGASSIMVLVALVAFVRTMWGWL